MVIVRIIGGLGNQLFQYAAGRRLSILHKTELKLDISAFEYYTCHAYSLEPFCITEVFATSSEVAAVTGAGSGIPARIVSRICRRLNPAYRSPVFAESTLRPFDASITKTPKDVYLDGYWQSEKYFIDIQDVIRQELTVKVEQDDGNRTLAEEITESQSVSLHIRRGNYVTNPEVNRVHGTCDLDYYHECARRLGREIVDPHFFVFSDDPLWAKENLHLEYPTILVDQNDAAHDYEDLRLMSLCKHNIIANSSFSWWGAWLNANPDKVVCAPKKWFNEADFDTRDLLPATWARI